MILLSKELYSRRGEGEYCAPVTTTKGTYLDALDHPLMVFRFIYKSARKLFHSFILEFFNQLMYVLC